MTYNFLVYSLVSFSSIATKIFIIPLIANQSDDFANWDYFLNIFAITEILLTVKISTSFYRFFSAKIKDNQSLLTVGLIVSCFGGLVFTFLILHLISFNEQTATLAFIYFFTATFFVYYTESLRALDKIRQYKNIHLTRNIVFFILVLGTSIVSVDSGFITINLLIFYSVLSIILSVAMNNGRLFLSTFVFKYNSPNRYDCKKYILYSLPLAISSISWFGIRSLNRVVVDFKLGLIGLETFAIAFYLPSLFFLFGKISFSTLQDYFTIKKFNLNFEENSIFNFFVLLNFILLIILLLMASSINNFFFNKSNEVIIYISKILLFAAFFHNLAAIQSAKFIELKRTKELLKGSVFGFLVYLLLMILIDHFSNNILKSVSVITCIGFMLTFLYRLILQSKILKFKLNKYSLITTLSCITLLYYYLHHDA